jgi:hypothetical protein
METIRDIPSAGANVANALGQGLGAGLQQLANARLQHVTEQKEAMKRERGLVSSGIFDTKEAKWASQLPDKLLDTVIKQKLQARSMEAFGQAFAPANNVAPNAGTNATGFGGGAGLNTGGSGGGSGVNALSGLGGGNAGNAGAASNTYSPVQANYAAMNPQQASVVAQMNETRRRDAEKAAREDKNFGLKKEEFEFKKNIAQGNQEIKRGNLEEKKKGTEIKKLAQEEKKSQDLWKHNEDYITEVNNKAAMADEMEKSLVAMETALDSGNLPSPTLFKAQKFFGADIGDFLSDNAQVVIKAGETMKSSMLKEYAGMGKLLASEFESLGNRVPGLLNDEPGARKLIALIRKHYTDSKYEKTVQDRLIAENNGNPPRNLKSMVYDDPGLKTMKKETLTDIRRIVSNQPHGHDELPDPSSRPVEALMETKNKRGYLVNTGTEWKSIAEFNPADQKRILAKYGINMGAR